MAINKVVYGEDTLVDLTEDTVTAEDVLNSKSFHTPDGVKRTGTASYPVTDVQVNGTSVMDGTVAKVEQPTAEVKSATEQFTTADGGLLSKCQINLVPVQSGSGDPYPAGGGKNKLPLVLADIKSLNTSGTWSGNVYTINGGTFKVLTDNANNVIGINVNGTFNATTTLAIVPSTSDNNFVGEILNCNGVVNESQSISLQYFNGTTYVNYYILQNSTDNYTITNAGNKVQIMVRIASGQTVNNIVLKPMIRLSTETDPTFAPYSNVRPISGHTEVDLLRCGKNLYNGLSEIGSWVKQRCTATFNGDGSITATNTQSGGTWIGFIGTVGITVNINNCPCSKGDSLIITSGNDTVCSSISVGELDSSNILLKTANITSGATYTVTEDDTTAIVLRYNFNLSDGATGTIYPMIRLATDTDSTFEPYLGHLYQVQIGSTVYGGYVDLVSGVMVVTYAFMTFDGTENWQIGSGNAYLGIVGMKSGNNQWGLCSILPRGIESGCIRFGYTNTRIYIMDCVTAYELDTATKVKAFMNGAEIVYPLDTPLTIQLTPQQIETLAGQNNLSTPLDGQSIETNGVEYKELFTFADVKEYVDKKIPDAPTTDGTYTLQAVVSGGVPTYSWV